MGDGTSTGFVHMRSLSGHRASYQNLFGSIFSLTPSVGKVTVKELRRLFAAERLLFGSLDDDCFGFFVVAISRAILGKRTTGLVIRPQSCFGRGPKSFVKYLAFRVLKRTTKITVCTIVPFSIAPQYQRIADVGLQDPQLWDMTCSSGTSCPALAKLVRKKADGRIVLSFLGSAGRNKGISFLADLISSEEFDSEHYCTVVAGNLDAIDSTTLSKLSDGGALLIARTITDAELYALYNVSDLIWSCYHPSYDQASGIFGRALQLGKTPILRRSSLIHRLAEEIGAPSIDLNYGDLVGAIQALSVAAEKFQDHLTPKAPDMSASANEWRESFVRHLSSSL